MVDQKTIYTEELKILVAHIREVRTAAGMTQTELARRLGKKSHSAVVKLEQGQVRVEVLELRRICSACGVQFQDFIEHLEKDLQQADQKPR